MQQDDADHRGHVAASTDRQRAEQAQPDPERMQNPPLRGTAGSTQPKGQTQEEQGEQDAQDDEKKQRGSPNVHMEPGHDDDPAATEGERPKFDR